LPFYGYVPPVYYGPGFYGWAWNPWPAAAAYAWGWGGSPWVDYYGGYFAPAPVYPTAALWLTDYMLAEYLQRAWEDRQQGDTPPPSPGAAIITPEIKQAIADEVRQEISAEYAAANQTASPVADQTPAALDPNQRIFVVSTSFVAGVGAGECGLTSGDIIARTNYTTISARNTVSVNVLSSKPGDCPVHTVAEVDVAALQEMHNQLRDYVDSGLKVLADNQGKDGIPAGPTPDARPSTDGDSQPDSAESVAGALAQQQQEASQALQEVQRPAEN
jgi:hypothetical protein